MTLRTNEVKAFMVEPALEISNSAGITVFEIYAAPPKVNFLQNGKLVEIKADGDLTLAFVASLQAIWGERLFKKGVQKEDLKKIVSGLKYIITKLDRG